MSFTKKIAYFLVHNLGMTNKKARQLIREGQVRIAGKPVMENCLLEEHAEIRVNDAVVRPAKKSVYLKFNKPTGYESTLNSLVEHSLSAFFKETAGLAIAGRLDKQSEGLLLLSNDGKWVEQICNPAFEKEKEYLVELDRPADIAFLTAFAEGVQIGGYRTKPCLCRFEKDSWIRVILKEGKNRQIRRMSRVLGYKVLTLKRIRIADQVLGDLQPGESQAFHL